MSRHVLAERWLSVAVVALGLGAVSAEAQECAYLGATENFNEIAYCVSSVLKGRYTYGPENLFDGKADTAWCEGVPGTGVGEVITLRIDEGGPFRRLLIENGYGKSDALFHRNARPRTIELRTDTGLSIRHELEDTPFERVIELPRPDAYEVLQIRVVDVYPGTQYQDLCISSLVIDFDYEKYLEVQNQGLGPDDGAADMPDSDPAPPAKLEELPPLPEL